MQLLETVRLLKKAKNGQDSQTILDLLNSLGDRPISIEDLKATKIGHMVTSLKKYPDAEVRASAIAVLKRLKRQAKKALGKSGSNKPKPQPKQSGTGAQDSSSARAPIVRKEERPVVPVSVWDVDDYLTGVKTRDVVLRKICAALKTEKPITNYVKLGMEIENELWRTYGRDTKGYANKYRDILPNIKKVPEFRDDILAGRVSPQELMTMPVENMAGSKKIKARLAAKEWELKARDSDAKKKAAQKITNAYRCGKCRNNRCSYYQIQIRGADEPMTTFVTCLKCGKRWKD